MRGGGGMGDDGRSSRSATVAAVSTLKERPAIPRETADERREPSAPLLPAEPKADLEAALAVQNIIKRLYPSVPEN